MSVLRGGATTLFAALIVLAPVRAADAEIIDLAARVDSQDLVVSFRLEGVPSQEMLDRLHTGVPIKFRHRVDMILKRSVLLPNRTLARTTVETLVEYDALTRQYALLRRTQNRNRSDRGPIIDFDVRRRTQSLEEALHWMTVLQDVPIPWQPAVADDRRLRVRVHSSLGRRLVLYMFPSTRSVSAEARIEF